MKIECSFCRPNWFPLQCFLLFLAFGCAYDNQQQKQAADGGEDMIDDCRLAHLIKFTQRGRLVDVRKNWEVADALGRVSPSSRLGHASSLLYIT